MSILFFLVFMIPNTDRPTLVLMRSFHTAKECNEVLAMAPPKSKNNFACIAIEHNPESTERI